MTEFFKVAGLMNWLTETDMCHGLWDRLVKDHQLKKVDEIWKLKLSIEDLMCELFDEATAQGDWGLYMQLEYFIKSVLARTTDREAWPPMDQFVAALEPNAGLITFNYDCLLEKSLIKSDWCPETGYKCLFQGRFLNRDGKDVMSQRVGGITSSWDYLKLHGSLNWLVDRDVHANWVFGTGKLTSGMSLFAYLLEAIRPESQDYPFTNLSGHLEDDRGADLFSLIIPPSRKKEYGEYRAILGYLWDVAQRKITESDELVFIGFSFPRTDENIKILFNEFRGSTVNVVNRTIDDGLSERYQSIFPRACVEFHQETFEEYCSKLKPLIPALKKSQISLPDCPEVVPDKLSANVVLFPGNDRSEVEVQGHLADGQITAKIEFEHQDYVRKRFEQYRQLGIDSLIAVAIAEEAAAIARALPCGRLQAKSSTRDALGKTNQFTVTLECHWTGTADVIVNLADFVPRAIRNLREQLDAKIDADERKRIAGASKVLGISRLI